MLATTKKPALSIGLRTSTDQPPRGTHRDAKRASRPSRFHAVLVAGLSFACASLGTNNAVAQTPIGLGALSSAIIDHHVDLQPLFTRAPAKRLDCHQTGPLFDQYFYRAETVSIGGPENSSSNPTFGQDAFGLDGSLINPGHRYRSITRPTLPDVGSGSGFNSASGTAVTLSPPPTSRFLSGDFNIKNGGFAATVQDDVTASPLGASTLKVSWVETYELTGPLFGPNGTYSFGGGFGVDIDMPLGGPFPGAAAVSLTTHLVTNGNLHDPSGDILADIGCHKLPTILGAVSEGTSDGVDDNFGPDENYFGNADFGVVMPGDPYLGSDGAVNRTRTVVAGTAKHELRGTWVTDPFYVAPLNPTDPVLLSFYHTATIIADPGATVTLAPLSEADLALLPHDADYFVVATGVNVPEPSAAVAALLAACTASVVGMRTRLG